MESYEPDTHSFVVKVWLEEKAEPGARPFWRGHVTHVISGNRRYVQSLAEITGFIEGYLVGIGIMPEASRRGPRWLSGRRKSK